MLSYKTPCEDSLSFLLLWITFESVTFSSFVSSKIPSQLRKQFSGDYEVKGVSLCTKTYITLTKHVGARRQLCGKIVIYIILQILYQFLQINIFFLKITLKSQNFTVWSYIGFECILKMINKTVLIISFLLYTPINVFYFHT